MSGLTVFLSILLLQLAIASDILVVILDQGSKYDRESATLLRNSINHQLAKHPAIITEIRTLHEDFADVRGGWAVWPLFKKLADSDFKWLFVCETDTVMISYGQLAETLMSLDSSESHFLGSALRDRTSAIIHHFADPKTVVYPDFGAGVAISRGLFERTLRRLEDGKPRDFTIDAKHELAMFLLDEGKGTHLVDDHIFCIHRESASCATAYEPEVDLCESSLSIDQLYFAVKTYHGYHKSRVAIVKRTWGKAPKFLDFFSDQEDMYIPTRVVGVNNTEKGHCEKTIRIIKTFVDEAESKGVKWLIIADDDTLLSVERILALLKCYESDSGPLILGERYGYGFDADGHSGYDYPTGGSGMIFNLAAAKLLSAECRCYAEDSPDDMILGLCALQENIPVVHNSGFHQARPIEYALEYLKRGPVLSFHKHYDVDPYMVYSEWLKEPTASKPFDHSEL